MVAESIGFRRGIQIGQTPSIHGTSKNIYSPEYTASLDPEMITLVTINRLEIMKIIIILF